MAESSPEKSGSLTPDEILSKMERFCAYQERSPKEVRTKLAVLGADAETAGKIMQVLEGERYFDERRFATAFARGKFRNNHWGRVRIRLELLKRSIAAPVIEEAVAEIQGAEYEAMLLKLTEKKMNENGPEERARLKTAQSMIRAGYEPELVFEIIAKLS